MQLGTRWPAGSDVPPSVPAALATEIAAAEQSLPQTGPTPMWTLTWLEGRPIAELDTGIEISIDREGVATVSTFDPMD
ncbi:hypothetical protein GCM10010915_20830 [Microbacterium faecale]|uniref:Fe-S oxidoreductase n=2 Tax=Microbacterium faecale TaxID=1804630 RepID=A0A917DIU5_9MICO|nr:hypothetical protein GCM10010915_20830 [Microbacterium faecale]